MGMFDSIRPEKAWCPYCGFEMDHPEFQTKDGECTLAEYYTFEAFGETVPKMGTFSAYERCPNCDKWIELQVPNESKAYKEYESQRSEEFRAKWKEQDRVYAEKATSEHPNHPIDSENFSQVHVDNYQCSKCIEERIERGQPHPALPCSRHYLDAEAQYLKEHPDTCPSCGKSNFMAFGSKIMKERFAFVNIHLDEEDFPDALCDNCLIHQLCRTDLKEFVGFAKN